MLSCYCYMLWFIRVDDWDGTFPRNYDLHSDATEEAICQQQIQEHKEELVNNLPSPSWLTTQFYCTDTFFFFFQFAAGLYTFIIRHRFLSLSDVRQQNKMACEALMVLFLLGRITQPLCLLILCLLYLVLQSWTSCIYSVYQSLLLPPIGKTDLPLKNTQKTHAESTKMGFKWMLTKAKMKVDITLTPESHFFVIRTLCF